MGDAESSRCDAESSLWDSKSSLGDVKSSLGDVKSSLLLLRVHTLSSPGENHSGQQCVYPGYVEVRALEQVHTGYAYLLLLLRRRHRHCRSCRPSSPLSTSAGATTPRRTKVYEAVSSLRVLSPLSTGGGGRRVLTCHHCGCGATVAWRQRAPSTAPAAVPVCPCHAAQWKEPHAGCCWRRTSWRRRRRRCRGERRATR